MTQKQKKLIIALTVFALANAVVPAANAMHIMEGYLPATFCVAWGILCLPFLFAGFFSIQKTLRENRRKITLLAMSGAFIFVISSLKIPSLTGSCSHMTGTGLGAILFGPLSGSCPGTHGPSLPGSFAGPRRDHHPGGKYLFHGCGRSPSCLGDLPGMPEAAYKPEGFLSSWLPPWGTFSPTAVTSLQLALAYPSPMGGVGASMVKFLVVFAPTQLPLAVIEGLLTHRHPAFPGVLRPSGTAGHRI